MRNIREILKEVIKFDWKSTPEERTIESFNGGKPIEAKELQEKKFEKIGSLEDSGHDIYHHQKSAIGGRSVLYIAHHRDSKIAHVTFTGFTNEDNSDVSSDVPIHPRNIEVSSLVSHPNNTLPAHKFYHHLINDHDKILFTHTQTVGGFKVWQKLSQEPNTHIQTFDPITKKTHNIKSLDTDEKTHARASQYYGDNKKMTPEDRKRQYIARLYLVASKKK